MIRTAVKIAYLGECFSGSQMQPGFRTVGGDILSDLKTITKMHDEEIDLKLASRTDKGVNALGNVAVFSSNIEDPDIILKALNAVSKDIFYRSVAFVNDDFNPRFAEMRRYRYVLRSDGMDLPAMRECAELFVGEHDFVRFCKPDGKSTTAVLNSVDIRKEDGVIILDFAARYFLWNMVRRIVAAIASVGGGDSSLSDVKDVLDGKDMTFGIARPDALTLTDVYYKNVEFMTPSADVLDRRIEEEMFKDKLKNLFFASL
ncbi:tRNA pseudouridine synthase A [Candidatus Methanoplasma termitum]|uniref:tRNA pseudouridine synthase A n=1 Tax=Candidatus Methanoplasma termitum TaxID=1577791 RepID=A0A0A7LIA5_9ARCH|nr:tRNA pseudouridine(38-40) synthase TruA [Candidatus Methanoplasma termitum]AIZ57236.1 tRNA pseudouridine synthase A [Candidatus Methanoplasma termitum]MCL2334329.1 tRNA pseudouridine(38-40) synthase TruA [Candidatus Methanoplasma sp.]